MVDQVGDVSEQTLARAQNAAAATEQQTASITEVTTNIRSLSTQATELRDLVDQFEVEGEATVASVADPATDGDDAGADLVHEGPMDDGPIGEDSANDAPGDERDATVGDDEFPTTEEDEWTPITDEEERPSDDESPADFGDDGAPTAEAEAAVGAGEQTGDDSRFGRVTDGAAGLVTGVTERARVPGRADVSGRFAGASDRMKGVKRRVSGAVGGLTDRRSAGDDPLDDALGTDDDGLPVEGDGAEVDDDPSATEFDDPAAVSDDD